MGAQTAPRKALSLRSPQRPTPREEMVHVFNEEKGKFEQVHYRKVSQFNREQVVKRQFNREQTKYLLAEETTQMEGRKKRAETRAKAGKAGVSAMAEPIGGPSRGTHEEAAPRALRSSGGFRLPPLFCSGVDVEPVSGALRLVLARFVVGGSPLISLVDVS